MKWRNAKSRLPALHHRVLVVTGTTIVIGWLSDEHEWYKDNETSADIHNVTHWKLLPKLPNE